MVSGGGSGRLAGRPPALAGVPQRHADPGAGPAGLLGTACCQVLATFGRTYIPVARVPSGFRMAIACACLPDMS